MRGSEDRLEELLFVKQFEAYRIALGRVLRHRLMVQNRDDQAY